MTKQAPKQRKAQARATKARGKTGRKLSQRQTTVGRFGAVARTLSLLNKQLETVNEGFAEMSAFIEELVKVNGLKMPSAPEESPEPIELAPTDANGTPVEDDTKTGALNG
jgi:hypothetical protein